MQIQSPIVATIAAAAAAQSASKDRSSGSEATHAMGTFGAETIGRTEQASADRDAQGGGEGLDHGLHRRHRQPTAILQPEDSTSDHELQAISTDPPSQLDIVG